MNALKQWQGAVREHDVATAKQAAESCDASRQRDQIIRLLSAALDGMTPDELAEKMVPRPHRSTVASRLAQMKKDGSVYPFGSRPAPSGRSAQIWHKCFQSRVADVETGTRL